MSSSSSATLPASSDEFVHEKDEFGRTVRTYRKGKLLGQGGFAKVFHVTDQLSNKQYACKIIDKSKLTKPATKAKLRSEIKIHQRLKHQYIVNFLHHFEDPENVYFILELCEGQSLMELQRRKRQLSEIEAQYFLLQLLEAMKFMHSKQVIHRDLKLGNIFLNKDFDIKVGDFGLATEVEDGERKRTMCGTPNYIAPEILENKNGHSFEVDIWSLGVILYTLLVGKPPFETSDVKLTYQKIKQGQYSFPEALQISSAARSLIRRILISDPDNRPTLEEIRTDPFFAMTPANLMTCPPYTLFPEKHPSYYSLRARQEHWPCFAPRAPLQSLQQGSPVKKVYSAMGPPQPIKVATGSAATTAAASAAAPSGPISSLKAALWGAKTPSTTNPPAPATAAPPQPSAAVIAITNVPAPNAAAVVAEPRKSVGPSIGSAAVAATTSLPKPTASSASSPQTDVPPALPNFQGRMSNGGGRTSPSPPPPASARLDSARAHNEESTPQQQEPVQRRLSGRASMGGSSGRRTPPLPPPPPPLSPPPPISSTSPASESVPPAPSGGRNSGRFSPAPSPLLPNTALPTFAAAGPVVVAPQIPTVPTTASNENGNGAQAGGAGGAELEDMTRQFKRHCHIDTPQRHSTSIQAVIGNTGSRRASSSSSGSSSSATTGPQTQSPLLQVDSRPLVAAPVPVSAPAPMEVCDDGAGGVGAAESGSNNDPDAMEDRCNLTRMHQQLEATLQNVAIEMNVDAEPTAPVPAASSSIPVLFVTEYANFSAKYGLAYLLCNGICGARFNDSTYMLWNPATNQIDYISRPNGANQAEERLQVTPETYPESLKKKITLIKYFRAYLEKSKGRSGATSEGSSGVPVVQCSPNVQGPLPIQTPSPVYVKRWVLTRQAMLLRMSNKAVQVAFVDQTQLVLGADDASVHFIDKNGAYSRFLTNQRQQPPPPEVARRIKFTKEILAQLLNNNFTSANGNKPTHKPQ